MSKATKHHSTSLTRRALLADAAAADPFVAPATAGVNKALVSAAEPEDPILPLYREWMAARIEWCRLSDLPGNGNWDSPESIAAEAREDAAFSAMVDMTPTGMAGIAALAVVLWDWSGPCSVPLDEAAFREQCDEPSNKLILAIWRAASGRNGLPPRARAGWEEAT